MLLREFLGLGGKKKEFKKDDLVTIKKGLYRKYVGKVEKVKPKGLVVVRWTGETAKTEKIKDLTLFDKKLPMEIGEVVKETNKHWGGIGRVYHVNDDLKSVEVFWNDGTFSKVEIKNLEKSNRRR